MPRRKLTTRERVRKFRKKDPFMSSIEMGKRLGLSSRGIRRIIASEDELINKPPRPKHVSYCLVCNTLLDTKRKFCGFQLLKRSMLFISKDFLNFISNSYMKR